MKSTKIYIRRQKQEIRQSGAGLEEQLTLIAKLYQGLGIAKPTKKVKTK
jgi:hypothetical protein